MQQIEITINSDQKLFPLAGPPIVVGRHPDCQFVVNGPNAEKASSRHLQILTDGDHVFIEDLGSSNGTLLNGDRCQSRQPLRTGDKVQLGSTGPDLDFKFVEVDSVPPIPARPESTPRSAHDSPRSLPTPASFIGGQSNSLSDAPVPSAPVPNQANKQSAPIQSATETANPQPIPDTPSHKPASPAATPSKPATGDPYLDSNSDSNSDAPKEPTTRQLLLNLKTRNRTTWMIAGSISLIVIVGFAVGFSIYWNQYQTAQSETENKLNEISGDQEKTNEDLKKVKETQKSTYRKISELEDAEKRIYRQTVQATAFIKNFNPGSRKYWRGSGFLVDKEKGIIVTNHHVIAEGKLIDVWFPAKKANGSYELNLSHYFRNVKPLRAKLIKSDPAKDLAIIQVTLRPEHSSITPLEIVTKPAEPGDKSYTTGSPGSVAINGWAFSSGAVKTFIPNWSAKYANGQAVFADVIVTDNSIEKGDSGGPVVNGQGKLIGVVSSLSGRKLTIDEKKKIQIVGPRLQNNFIAANEVTTFLKKHLK